MILQIKSFYRTFIVQMAGLTFLYRSKKPRAPLTARLRFRHEGKDYTYDSKTNVVVSKLYWRDYHSKQRISDPEIKNDTFISNLSEITLSYTFYENSDT